METKNKVGFMEFLRRRIGRDFGNSYYVEPNGLSGGLALWWNDNVHINILASSSNIVDANVFLHDRNVSWHMSFVYGSPARENKAKIWEALGNLNFATSELWACIGDFNSIISQDEKWGGNDMRNSQVQDMIQFINQAALLDLECKGPPFTWYNKQFGENAIQERLDRFEEKWLQHPDCNSVIATAWKQPITGSPMFSAVQKLKSCRKSLARWNTEVFCGNKAKIKNLHLQLENLYNHPMEEGNREVEYKILSRLNELCKRDEAHWKQHSRISWLIEGDKNTRFFHLSTIQRRHRNSIVRLQQANGEWIDAEHHIKEEIVSYFQNLYSKSPTQGEEDVISFLPKCVTPEMNNSLLALVINEEIKTVAFALGGSKALGPDGFSGLFYQQNWDTVGEDVCCAIKIVLLKPWMDYLISQDQAAFIPSRAIQDNIIIVHEAFHFLRTSNSRSHSMAIKLDMHKAYDQVDWDFLEKVLTQLGFDRRWVKLVMQRVSTVSFSILINGAPSESFILTRGLRQGDPLSPYLFLFVSQALSSLIAHAKELGQIKGLKINRTTPVITNVLFADDTLLFGKANKGEAMAIMSIIDRYSAASSQKAKEAAAIKLIPVAPMGCQDSIVWYFDRSGVYSVKSGYRFLVNKARNANAQHPHQSFSISKDV
ncbi:uncharacterized protein LOC131171150 [Hevea brasiliensis]|uniref:uncharacterized protein LOC131171150 n=1 Tax=Hevea brasiliensis TaxID=3981 RepID=UPI0025F9AC47|nr:uncharacterized protein LOC131171150 [Hevea brasiliensis]